MLFIKDIHQMKQCFLFMIFTLTSLFIQVNRALAQKVTLHDDFSESALNGNVKWVGNTSDFTIVDQGNNRLLRLGAQKAGTAWLSTKSIAAFGSWSFFIDLDFPPSNSNHAEIFLTSDKMDLSDNPSGYVLIAGENGSGDVFHLVRYDSGKIVQTILSGKTNISKGGGFRVNITRDTTGLWKLFVSQGASSTPQLDGTGTDRFYTSSKYFGLSLKFTSTRTDQFYFDDFQIIKDPIFLLGAKEYDSKAVDVIFSEAPDSSTVTPTNFSLDSGIGTPDNVKIIHQDTVRLFFHNSITSGLHSIRVHGVKDLSGQAIKANTNTSVMFIDMAEPGDIAISEFMYDPPAGLPEYVELYNNSDKLFDLSDWQLKDNTETIRKISDKPLYFKPHEYLVLTSDTTELHDWFGSRNYVLMPDFPSLNNSFDAIRLITKNQEVIDSLNYTSAWGGVHVSLERKSYSVLAYFQENWGDSPSNLQGTPGEANLIEPDKTPPSLKSLHLTGGRYITTIFSEMLDRRSAEDIKDFDFSPSVKIDSITLHTDTVKIVLSEKLQYKVPYKVTFHDLRDLFGNAIKPVTDTLIYAPDITPPKVLSAFYNASSDSVYIICNEPIQLNSGMSLTSSNLDVEGIGVNAQDSTHLSVAITSHSDSHSDDHLRIQNLTDRNGNALKDTTVIIARTGRPGDIVINEIMYNPIADNQDYRPDQSEYVEIYNRSAFTISLNGYSIHNAPDENGKISSLYPLSTINKELSPKHFVVICADTSDYFKNSRIAKFFTISSDSNQFLRVNRTNLSLSSQNDAVFLANRYGFTIDSVYYSDAWQNLNLAGTHGISLERINPLGDSNDRTNWGSCAASKGGTPDMPNSIYEEPKAVLTHDGISLKPNPFSPDHDGFNDHLLISYSLSDPNYLLHIRIYDRYGRLVRTLANGRRAGTSGSISWDGLTDNGRPDRIGIYIIWFEAYDSANGKREVFKKTAVLARKL